MTTRRRMGAAQRAAASVVLAAISACLCAASADAGAASKAPPPRAPSTLRVTAAKQTSLRLSWKASPDTKRVTGYYLYRGSPRVASVGRRTTAYTFRGLRCGTRYTLGVAAHDAKPTASRRATARGRTTACPVPPDRQAPTAPSLTLTSSSGSSLAVAWTAATDNVGVNGYSVYVSGMRVATTTATAYTFASLTCGTTYDVAVEAFDAAGNVSTRTTVQAATAACPDTQAPTKPANLRVIASTSSSLTLAWDASADDVGVTGYNAFANWTMGLKSFSATTTATSVTISGLFCNVGYAIGVVAFDAAGNTSTPALMDTLAFIECPDSQAPTVPSNLHVTASSGSSLTVAWHGSTDNVGVKGYDVYVPGGTAVTTTDTSATLAGLTCGKEYAVVADAVDAAGNVSGRTTLTDWTDLCPASPPSGGTLRVDLTSDFDFTDPALDYFSFGWQLQYATGLRLYNYPDRPAPEGSVLVHEAAAGYPLISDDGKTYTITVKPGFKFSDGTPVTAANFAYAINRALNPKMSSPAIDFIRDIAGAQDVIDGKTTTASGVQVQGDKLTVQLVKPAGDFIARLALPFFSAVKTDMPIDPAGVAVYPSAGPYHVTSWVPKSSATLQRNPFYPGPRPANADTIQYTIGLTLAAQELRVINGDTDLGGFPAADAANLANTYGVNAPDGQFHTSTQNTMWYVNLNTSRAPFNNVDLRKAVNYAVDRPLLAAQMGAYAATPTDQILPPGIRGFRDEDIYPLGGPNLDKARALAGNSCGTVKLWSFNTSFGPAWANVLKSNLEQIGCTVQVSLLDRVVETTQGGTRGADFDLLVNGWGQDYPDPYDFLDVLLNGNSIKDTNNVNLSYFDDPTVNAKLAAASALTGGARYQTYGDLDVEIMRDYAPWIAVVDTNARIFHSSHVSGFVYQPAFGADLNTFFVE